MNVGTPSDERVAIVTGGGRGIGREIALRLAQDGLRVVIASRTHRDLQDVAQASDRILPVTADVANSADRQRLVTEAVSAFGRLDVLVNSAVHPHTGSLSDGTEADLVGLLDVVLLAALHLSQLALPHMQAVEFGRIVNITSGASWNPVARMGAYGIAKAALNRLTKQLAAEVSARSAITVNGLAPGFVLTSSVEWAVERAAAAGRDPEAYRQEIIERMVEPDPLSFLKRPVEAAEVAAVVSFLCSQGASAMTGEVLNLGGGWTAR